MQNSIEHEKELAAQEAVKVLSDGQVVGLGTGSTAAYAIKAIGTLVANGLKIQAVPTSSKTQNLALALSIPLIDANAVDTIDVTIDGADEFDLSLNLIKGGGGALLKEKIVASMTRELIIIADSTKKVDTLGKFKLPVEVIPFASTYVKNKIRELGGEGVIRMAGGVPFTTEEGNHIIDVSFGLIDDAASLSVQLNEIEGLVAHGLFLNLAKKVIMGVGTSTKTYLPDKR